MLFQPLVPFPEPVGSGEGGKPGAALFPVQGSRIITISVARIRKMQRFGSLIINSLKHRRSLIALHTGAENPAERPDRFRMDRVDRTVPDLCQRILRAEQFRSVRAPACGMIEIPAQQFSAHLHGKPGRKIAGSPAGKMIEGKVIRNPLTVRGLRQHVKMRRGKMPL